MDKYKKKSLKFMGFSRELRNNERTNERFLSRHQRFSICRTLDDEGKSEEKKENCVSSIPTKDKPEAQAGSRLELLYKWRQEKVLKKQHESKLKKPAFKVGVIKPANPPFLSPKPLFALDSSSRLFKSSFQASNSQLFGRKPDPNTSRAKASVKVSSYQSFIKPEVGATNTTMGAKSLKIPSSKTNVVTNKFESKWTKNKDSGIQSFSTKPKIDTPKGMNKDPSSGSKKQPISSKPLELKKDPSSSSKKQPISSKPPEAKKDPPSNIKKLPVLSSKPLEAKELRLQPLNTRSKVSSIPNYAKSNIPSTGLPKLAIPRTLNKFSNQNHDAKPTAPKIPVGNSTEKQPPVKSNVVKSIPKCTRKVTSNQKSSISEEKSKSDSQETTRTENFELSTCDLSYIEPVPEAKKSFAPEGFMFQPPAELNSSLFLEDGPSAIFMRMRNQFLRTSTPKQETLHRKSSTSNKDAECKDSQCANDKSAEVKESMSTDKNDVETVLSSSLKSILLNDLTPTDCKQSSGFAEVTPTRNKEESLLPSVILHPENSVVAEPQTGAVDPPDKVEIEKTKLKFADAGTANDLKIVVIATEVDSVASEDKEIPDLLSIEPDQNVGKNLNLLSAFLPKESNNPVSVPEIKPTRSFKRSVKPVLSSINESLENRASVENTPKSALKKTIRDNVFTPRRSVRLARRSGNFSSLENLLDSPKRQQNNKSDKVDLVPRRSSRLSKFSTEFNSAENLFDIRRPTLFGTPEEDKPAQKFHSKGTYDFDRLSSEAEEMTRPMTRSGKVSLLYTPPNKSRPSVMRKSIKGDLMTFSPNF